MRIRCPVCGASIDAGLIPTARNVSFPCSRCRTQLEVAAADAVPILAVSAMLAVGFSVLLGVRGYALVLTIVAAAAAFYGLGMLAQNVVAVPKLRKSRSNVKLLHVARRIHSSR